MTPDLTPLFSASPQAHAHDVYRELRESAPVVRVPDSRTWIVTTYDDVRAIVRDTSTWSSHYPERFGSGLAERAIPTARTEAALAKGYPYVPTLLFQDGPEHRRHRAVLQKALTPARVRGLEASVAAIAHRLADAFAAGATVHFVRDFATPLPIAVLGEALAVDEADAERFARWSESIVHLGAPADEDESVRIAEDYVAFQHYLAGRIQAPGGDDLLSALVAAHLETSGELVLPELLGICTLLLAAGNDTSTAALTALVHRMLVEPGLMATLREDRTQIGPALEEALRLDAPVQMFQRKATRDTELHGQPIRRGDMAMVVYASANRDGAHWDEPDAFRLGRPNIRDHLAFTHGPHRCAGAMLARTEVRVAVGVLLDRVAAMELDEQRPVELLPELMTRSYRELPLVVSA